MKNGLSGILEALRVLNEGGCNFPGELLVTVYGQHESPWSTHEPLTHLLQNGVKGDAAIVAESFSETAVIAAKGQAIWNIDLRRKGDVCHELSRAPEADHLLEAAVLAINTIKQKNQGLAAREHNYPLLGPESLFIGQVHYGDFYNRVPIECKLQGTFRWHPHHSFKAVQEDLKETLAGAALPKSISVEISWKLSGQSYQVDPEEQIIKSQISSYRNIMGKELETGGTPVITDACRIVRIGKVPTAVLGFGGKMAHADFEFVHLDHVVQACKWLVCLILDYLQSSE